MHGCMYVSMYVCICFLGWTFQHAHERSFDLGHFDRGATAGLIDAWAVDEVSPGSLLRSLT